MSETQRVRCAPLILLTVFLGALPAHAQAVAPACYSPDRLGWVGPSVEIGCLQCCGCRGAFNMEWQYRSEDAGWSGTQPTFSVPGRYTNNPFQSLTHLARYCTRVRFSDDAGPGQWGPSSTAMCSDAGSDVCFTWDQSPPSAPVLLDGGVVPGTNRVELAFTPSTDDGGGVGRYSVRHLPGGASGSGSVTSPISDILGAGTWTLTVYAADLALNVSANAVPFTATFGFDASVAVAPAPAWEFAVTNQQYVELLWPDDGAESWVVSQRSLDGGWFIGARPRVSGLSALLNVPGPCRLHAARIGRVLGDQVSDWSAPSADLLMDSVAPVPADPQLASFDGGAALISWAAASDGCPSGLGYVLERSVDGSAFTLRATTIGTQVIDVVDVVGSLRWRLVAIDGAGNQGVSSGGASLLVVADDGGVVDSGVGPGVGVDAGMDSGVVDSGFVSDAGVEAMPRTLAVGCGCSTGSELGLLVLSFFLVWPSPRPSRRGRGR